MKNLQNITKRRGDEEAGVSAGKTDLSFRGDLRPSLAFAKL